MTANKLNNFMSDDSSDEQTSSRKWPLAIGGALTILLIVAGLFFSDLIISKKKAELLSEVKARQEITVSGKVEVIQTWVKETGQRANLIANHPLFRLFAAEVNQSNGEALPRALSNQLPYMQNAITNFVKENGLIAAYVIGKDGRAYLASNSSPGLTNHQRELASNHYKTDKISVSPMRVSGDLLVFDYLVPVFAAQAPAGRETEDVVGILLMTVSASQHLSDILKPSRLSADGEQTLLYQLSENQYYAITPTKAPYLSQKPAGVTSSTINSFSERQMSGSSLSIFSIGATVKETDWAVQQELPGSTALAPLEEYSYGIYGLSASFLVVILSVLTGIWLTLSNQNAKAMTKQYRDFARKINAQRRLLGSINNTIDELIGLTDAAGRYLYANPALARFTDFPLNSIEGKSDRDLFGDKTARKLTDLNQQVMDTHESVSTILELKTHQGARIIRIDKARLLDEEDHFLGIVTVAGDITDFMMHQRQKEELGRKTISILVRMMEDNDPYLAGHSSRMGDLSNKIAKILDLPEDVRQTIATGANLSQIGKVSIPAEIRTKEGRLNTEEMSTMQGHVGKAKSLLTEMDIQESIITAVTQMYERQDGSGYPNKLKGDEIQLSARILGMADILIARVSPRSYRQAISLEEAMEVFRSNPEKYDVDVVVALDSFLSSKKGKKFKESLSER